MSFPPELIGIAEYSRIVTRVPNPKPEHVTGRRGVEETLTGCGATASSSARTEPPVMVVDG